MAVSHRALPRLWHYYGPSDSSQRIGSLFPCGYGLPTLVGPARRADAAALVRRGLSTTARDATRSPQITPSALSPHPRPNHLCRPPGVADCRFPPRGQGRRLPGYAGPSPPAPALHGFTTRSGLQLCLRPLQTPPRSDALGFGYSTTNGQTLREDFHLPVAAASRQSPPRQRCCWAYRATRPATVWRASTCVRIVV
jgi:hypothetical protein